MAEKKSLAEWAALYFESISWLEKELGLPPDFIRHLGQEDDWSFIVKSHALVEAAISNQLSSSIDPRLASVFEELELSDPRKGKIAFSKALGLLENNQRTFIRFLSELRNQLVHNARSVTFNIEKHFAQLDTNQKDSFIRAITYFATNTEGWNAQARSNPKLAISAATIHLLIHSIVRANTDRAERELIYKKAKMLDDALGSAKPS